MKKKEIELFYQINSSAINMIIINNKKELVYSCYLDEKLIFFEIPSLNINVVIKNISIESFSMSMIYDDNNKLLFGCSYGVSFINIRNHKVLEYINLDMKGMCIIQRSNGNLLVRIEKYNKNNKNKINNWLYELKYSKEKK